MTGGAVDPEPAAAGRDSTRVHAPTVPAARSAFAPLALLGLALTFGAAGVLHQAWQEHGALAAARLGQERAFENARKMRDALDRMASHTQRLADKGNPNARLIVDELRRRGITIHPPGASAGTPPGP